MKENTRRRRGHGVLGVFAVLLVLVAALAVWQKNNIQAVLEYISAGSQEEIEEKLQQNQQAITDVMTKNPEIVVRDVTEEEKQALRDGTLSQEELTDRLLGVEAQKPDESEAKKDVSQKPEVQQPSEQPEQTPPTEEPVESEYQKQLSAQVAKVYVLREEFTIALDNLQAEATAAYKALTPEERSGGKLTKFISGFLAKGTALEKECDSKMDAIVVELVALIEANNGDMSIVDTMIEAYASEKSLKKAWYMAELEKKGLT